MPPAFSFPRRDVELWVPLVLSPDDYRDRNNNELYAVARLKPGATLDSARSEMDVLAAQSRTQYPEGEREHRRDGERTPRRAVAPVARAWSWRSAAPRSACC